MESGSGSSPEKQAIENYRKAADEKQRREVLRHDWGNASWQWNDKGIAVATGKIMDYGSEKHVKKAAANVAPPVWSRTARQLHLRNRLTAKRALRQSRRHALAAKYAAACLRGLLSKSAHRALNIPAT
jgi:hypothetical protein